MRKYITRILILVLTLNCSGFSLRAQSFEDVGQYMGHISKTNEKLTSMYLSYLSAVGHNKSARKVEKRRQEVVDNIFNSRLQIQGMPPWKGDRSYRDTTVTYLKLMYNVFNEDYAKIVNMEEIAEQSYDAMEAYMLAQEKANEKLQEASKRQQRVQKEFATKYNVTLVDNISELENKSKQAGELMNHYDKVYLIFFKAYKQEAYLMDAIDKKNITAIEQNKNALQAFAEEGFKTLKTLRGYNNDPSLIVACQKALQFYNDEAKKQQLATEFLLKEEAFAKLKKSFESKPAAKRTQQDVDAYNKGVNEINDAVNAYNALNNQINKERTRAIDNWNDTVRKYLDNYMPYQRKG